MLPDAELRAVASRDPVRGASFASRHAVPRVHANYEALVAEPDVDVVYIATLNVSHLEHSLLCLKSGKAVLCEKPFAMTADETRQIITAARRHRVFCMEAMWMRFVPLARALQALRSESDGPIGALRDVTANLGFSAPFDPRSRLFDKQQGGGALLDLGVYPISFIHMLMGAPHSVSSTARIGRTGVDEHVSAEFVFADGRSATMETSIVSGLAGDATITGSAGTIQVQGPLYCPTSLVYKTTPAGSLVKNRRLTTRWVDAARRWSGLDPTQRFPVIGTGFAHEAAEVIRCLRANKLESDIMPLDESLRVLETMDAIRTAWGRTGHVIVDRS